jgi:hypothetical protein
MEKFLLCLPRNQRPKRKFDQLSTASLSSTKERKLSQQFLDLGQKSLGATEQCSLCGFVYIKDDLEDIKAHNNYCCEVFFL